MNIRLYQSANKPSQTTLAALLHKVLERGNKAIVRCDSKEKATNLSESLWHSDSFLPHGIENNDSPEWQKIWIAYEKLTQNLIQANTLFLYDALIPDIEHSDKEFTDVILLFDKKDDEGVKKMRSFWKSLQEQDLPHIEKVSFWQQQNGKWIETAQGKK